MDVWPRSSGGTVFRMFMLSPTSCRSAHASPEKKSCSRFAVADVEGGPRKTSPGEPRPCWLSRVVCVPCKSKVFRGVCPILLTSCHTRFNFSEVFFFYCGTLYGARLVVVHLVRGLGIWRPYAALRAQTEAPKISPLPLVPPVTKPMSVPLRHGNTRPLYAKGWE